MNTGHIQPRKGLHFSKFKAALQKFIDAAASKMASESWFGDQLPEEKVLTKDFSGYSLTGEELFSSHFTPFIIKKIVPTDSQIRVVGDIHGDYLALETIVTRLIEDGFITADLRMTSSSHYLVFLGDYVNRTFGSAKVLMLLSILYAKNPDNVIVLRGNHETALSNTTFHNRFIAARETTFAQTTFLQELAERFPQYQFPDLLYWYDYLPLAAFIGTQTDDGAVSYAAFFHGGFELGHDLASFLADTASTAAVLTSINRRKALTQYIPLLELQDDIKRALAYVPTPEAQIFIDNQQLDELDPRSWHKHTSLRLGYLWNNFLTEENDQIKLTYSPLRRTLYLGEAVTKAFCTSPSGAQIKTVIRGHQHLDEQVDQLQLASTMFTRIKRDRGVVSQWGGLVHTLGAAQAITGVHSFAGLMLDASTNNWALRHYHKDPTDSDFSLIVTRLFN